MCIGNEQFKIKRKVYITNNKLFQKTYNELIKEQVGDDITKTLAVLVVTKKNTVLVRSCMHGPYKGFWTPVG